MKPRRPQDDLPKGLTHNPFAALRPEGAPAPRSDHEEAEAVAPDEPDSQPGGRLVVRREKKGRGGKTVTRIEGLELRPAELPDLARELKRALGCGASVEGADVLLQGSQTERVAAWLEKRFGTRVTIGN